MGKKDDLIAKATDMGIELDSRETIADLEAKIAAAEPNQTIEPEDEAPASGMTSGEAISALAAGQRVMRETWTDNHHLDPAHIRAGVRLTYDDIMAADWKAV